MCNGDLVFIDLDINGDWFSFKGGAWSTGAITLQNQCPSGAQLFPRSNGYAIGVTTITSAPGRPPADRLLLVGGSDAASRNNVYYSDNCGRSWACSSLPQIWSAQQYASILHAPPAGGFAPNQIFMGGGTASSGATSVGFYTSTDGGLTWSRPKCTNPTNCALECYSVPFSSQCTLRNGGTDAFGSCSNSSEWPLCLVLPDFPAYPGSLETDWDSLWLFMKPEDDGVVWRMRASDLTTGWELSSATWGGYGRRVFIKGTVQGTGCWFSTDYLAEDTCVAATGWLQVTPSTNSMNAFATASTPYGPWTNWSGVVTPPWPPRASAALTTGWDSTSAWLASGMNFVDGMPSTPVYSDAYLIDAGVCLLAPSTGKVCNGPAAGTPNLDSVTCACNAGYRGTFCEYCTGSQCSAPPAASAAAVAASTAGDVVAGVLGGLLAAGLVGLVVYVRFFGGGPSVVSAASCLTGAVAGGKSGSGAPLLKPSGAGSARFSSIGSSSL